jgi:NAD(P)-dependent dehydrogenase (short-subunit alcohol dehydrogenase family)
MASASGREQDFFRTFGPEAMRERGCVVTGAGGGMGRAVALRLAQAGAEVITTDIREDFLNETNDLIAAETGSRPAGSVVADVAESDVGKVVIGAAADRLSKLTTLVNCAGVARDASGPETFESWERIVRTNLNSIYLLSIASAPHMRAAGGGSIVNIASIIASRYYRGSGEHFAYPASKAGVLGLTQSMAIMFGKDAIRVNSVSPGFIRTPMGTRLVEGTERLNATDQGIPIGRIGEPDDIAAAVMFFASDASRYVTGTELKVDGGMSVEVGWDRFLV